MIKVIAKNNASDFETTISNGSHSIIADLPINTGGTNSGFAPKELLASALASCTIMFINEYCKKCDYKIFGVDVQVSLNASQNKAETIFVCDIKISGNLTYEIKQEIVEASKNCHIYNILAGSTIIQSNVSM